VLNDADLRGAAFGGWPAMTLRKRGGDSGGLQFAGMVSESATHSHARPLALPSRAICGMTQGTIPRNALTAEIIRQFAI